MCHVCKIASILSWKLGHICTEVGVFEISDLFFTELYNFRIFILYVFKG